ncbi:DUF2786 domain-containing protein [Pseudomonas nicosulfuronedens]|uniref:DUF7168 domain-containing protein n=1 Tax=Pseudomonas nicosulfuronedens TaxID=2571105 RepID=UPI00244C5AC9|nr:DUF2786 domain-containing protein [Pseudomonas nicosulfuronedens]MDH1009331.1 DUF2786 domain-containing protein [Pseudomonas nicosulfuronedens]MDH1978719.1 DUF2786 domain-containing protein [Pseudomonas nicosulfuronedens]MDH2026419.1 DUF2786 domain-containing protein [Pseudomonas nicosulfuronedens]
MDHSKALDKIKKLLRLAGSSNPHEAAAAMRQARAMMEKFGLGEADVTLSEVSEHSAASGSKVTPAQWEASLSLTVAQAYSCKTLFLPYAGSYRFIGEMAEVASYTMTILMRQVRKARRDYITTELKRCKPANKTKRADMFCEGWVWAIRQQVNQFAGNAQPSEAAESYLRWKYPSTVEKLPNDRNRKGKPSQRDLRDAGRGIDAADDVQLNHGVGGSAPLALT